MIKRGEDSDENVPDNMQKIENVRVIEVNRYRHQQWVPSFRESNSRGIIPGYFLGFNGYGRGLADV